MPQTTQEYIEITALIRGVLNGYPGNSAILREFIANSDDARATVQTFILDERVFPASSLVDPSLQDSQGPALLALNNSLIDEQDWIALRKIHSSSKRGDESQTGKNGLGFRASYHLTDNPHILSGTKLMILDPHEEFKEHAGGVTIDILDEASSYRDQLAPFSNLRGSDGDNQPYSGTAFRLPLRTTGQAARSRISDAPTTAEQISDIFKDFIASELQRVILFLKHITKIELKHIHANGRVEHLASIEIDNLDASARVGTVLRNVTLTLGEQAPSCVRWCFHHLLVDKDQAAAIISARVGYDARARMIADKLVAAVDVALPLLPTPPKGGCSTLMPLPVAFDGFPVYLNGVFALDQNRQNFKNIEEVGPIGSRERLLVEWNKTIFDTWAPVGWAKVLARVLQEMPSANVWDFLPSDVHGDRSYRSGLLRRLIEEIDTQNLSIFPTFSHNTSKALVSLRHSGVFIAQPTPAISLDVLSDVGFTVIQPPSHIFSIIESYPDLAVSILSPRLLYSRLLHNFPKMLLDEPYRNVKESIIEYLVFSQPDSSLALLIGLPAFRSFSGDTFAFQAATSRPAYIIPSSEEDSDIFQEHPQMLRWTSLPDKLRKALSEKSSAETLNVATLTVNDMLTYLKTRFIFSGHGDEVQVQDTATVLWLVRFWTWLVDSPHSAAFFARTSELSDAYILPTASQVLRKLSAKILDFRHLADRTEALRALATIGVRPIHPNVPYKVSQRLQDASLLHVPGTPAFVSLLLDICDTGRVPQILTGDRVHLQRILLDLLPYSRLSLWSSTQRVLLSLPIFSARKHGEDRYTLRSVDCVRYFTNVGQDHPLPVLSSDDALFVNLGEEATKRLSALADASSANALTLDGLLRLAVSHWANQPDSTRDDWAERFINHSTRTPAFKSLLINLAFVTVHGISHRVVPDNLVDPESPVARLYEGEPGKFPSGVFSGVLLNSLRSLGLVKTHLDTSIVSERLSFFRSTQSSDFMVLMKAKTFVDMLDRHWDSAYRTLIPNARQWSWLPLSSNALGPPETSRDRHEDEHNTSFYYDKVWDILPRDVLISNSAFRGALGWSRPVPFTTLIAQLQRTLAIADNSDRNRRVISLMIYFDNLDSGGHLSQNDLDEVRLLLRDRVWIPLSRLSSPSARIEHAVLENVNLAAPFASVHSDMPRGFLKKLGCTDRPQLEALVAEMNRPGVEIYDILVFLQEIAHNHPHFDRQLALVPDSQYPSQISPLSAVYYHDMPSHRSYTIPGRRATHGSISRSLAENLGIEFLSSLIDEDRGSDDEDDDDEQMAEDLSVRIRGFLRDYDPRFALNEFLANADDAGATQVSMLLMQGTPSSQHGDAVISPAFQSLSRESTLLIFNNAILTREDFLGLRRIGRGGKEGRHDTHGRHGLGALSSFYFTDVVTVISGDSLLILDPTGQYLPPQQRRKRTAMKKKLSFIFQHYPDQLKRYDDQFGFRNSLSDPYYNGTIFVFPLKASISEKSCSAATTASIIGSSYKELAKNSFYFTKLNHVAARIHRRREGHLSMSGWSFDASRTSPTIQHGAAFHILTIRPENGTSEDWLIATSRKDTIPAAHATTAAALKLSVHDPMLIQLAMRMEQGTLHAEDLSSCLFSTFQLPKKVALPIHVNSRFAISSNRQDVVFYPADSHNQVDPKTAFNTWIMESLLPPLYLACLSYRLHDLTSESSKFPVDKRQWWLNQATDETTKLVRQGLLRTLTSSSHRLFLAADDTWISYSEAIFSNNEPSSVTKLMVNLKAPAFVPRHGSRRTGLAEHAQSVITPDYVESILSRGGSLSSIQRLCDSDVIAHPTLLDVLDYLCSGGRTPALRGLPLLVLTTGAVVSVPGPTDRPAYYTPLTELHDLFSSSMFLSSQYSHRSHRPSLAQLLSMPSILELEGSHVRNLVSVELAHRSATYDDRAEWIDLFWKKFAHLPGPPKLDELDSPGLNLFRLKGRSEFISLGDCVPTNVVYGPNIPIDMGTTLPPILRSLDITVISPTGNPHVDTFVASRFPNFYDNLLQCLQAKGGSNLAGRLSPESHALFVEMIRHGINVSLHRWNRTAPVVDRAFLMTLPIWQAYSRDNISFKDAESVELTALPLEAMSHIQPYLRPALSTNVPVYVTPQSPALLKLLQFCGRESKIPSSSEPRDFYRLLDLMQLPPSIAFNSSLQSTLYKGFLRHILSLPVTMMPPQLSRQIVPDTNGVLRLPMELYDRSVPLFRITMALRSDESPKLVHRNFRDFTLQLRVLGLIHVVNSDTFYECATTVANAVHRLHGRGQPLTTCFSAADALFEAYQTTIFSQIVAQRDGGAQIWRRLDPISFMRRQPFARRGLTYTLEQQFHDSEPLIVAPTRLVRASFEPIAWTQRMLFMTEPEENLLKINDQLGVPNVHEVVQHLKVLATQIAPYHSRNTHLISDIKATYQWLNDNAPAAREYLLIAGQDKLFLNVDDAINESWDGQWCKADDLVLNLTYDHGTLRSVRKFLLPFEKLLSVAGSLNVGVSALSQQKSKSDVNSTHRQRWAVLNEMRKVGELTDMVLKPSLSDELSDLSELRAHRCVLASVVPHLRDALRGWRMGEHGEFDFYGGHFGARTLLNYIYTGDLGLPDSTMSEEDTAILLRDLLELLELSNRWSMTDLKDEIQDCIMYKYDMVPKMVHMFNEMMTSAVEHDATRLRTCLEEFRKSNFRLLKALEADA